MALVHFKKRALWESNLYHNKEAVKNLIEYALSDEKTPCRVYGAVGATAEDKETAIKQFHAVKKAYRNTKGKQALHFWVSFDDNERHTNKEYRHIGYKIAEFFNNEYQIIFALHENTDNPHIHFVVNTVNYMTGKKLRWQRGDFFELQKWVNNSLSHDFID